MNALTNRLSDRTLRALAGAMWWAFVLAMVVSSAIPLLAEGRDALGTVLNDLVFLVIVGIYPLTGVLVLRRQPRNAIGWILLAIGAVWAFGGFTDAYGSYGTDVAGSVPGPLVAAALNQGIWAPAIGLMTTYLILLYPDGHLPSPRWRWVGWLCGITLTVIYVGITLMPGEMTEGVGAGEANPLGVEPARELLQVAAPFCLALLPVCVVLCAIGLVRRFRRSTGIERQQLKWLAAAAGVMSSLFAVSMAITVIQTAVQDEGSKSWWISLLTEDLPVLSFTLVPVAIGVAILRYRLYDLDVVVNRALVYASLTVSLVAFYLASVLLLRLALEPIIGESDLAVAASTLAVAALFGPLRNRIQAVVDRRFYRRRYDAGRTLDSFGGRLRQQVDLQAIGTELRTVVGDTMQPQHVSLWMRGEQRS